jgi:hypothetical protein
MASLVKCPGLVCLEESAENVIDLSLRNRSCESSDISVPVATAIAMTINPSQIQFNIRRNYELFRVILSEAKNLRVWFTES